MEKLKDKIFIKKRGKSVIYKGFTLAEVLITLGILGVVAALTIPAIINRFNDMQYHTALKKAFSVFSQAHQMAATENGNSFVNALSSCTNTGDNICFRDALLEHLPYIEKCDANANDNLGVCFAPIGSVYWLNGTASEVGTVLTASVASGAVLKDGSSFIVYLDSPTCAAPTYNCGWLTVDVNGPKKKPNTMGKDIYLFYVFASAVRPKQGVDDCGTGINYGQSCALKYLSEND